jgi:hypothetical protein
MTQFVKLLPATVIWGFHSGISLTRATRAYLRRAPNYAIMLIIVTWRQFTSDKHASCYRLGANLAGS